MPVLKFVLAKCSFCVVIGNQHGCRTQRMNRETQDHKMGVIIQNYCDSLS